MTFLNLYLCITCFLTKPPDANIDSLYYAWNESTLHSLRDGIDQAVTAGEKHMYDNRLEERLSFIEYEHESLNEDWLRRKFLRKASASFNWKDKNWTVIEVIKSGERVRLMNYLICYGKSGARVIVYDYVSGDWVKISETKMRVKMKDLTLKTASGLYEKGDYFHDIIVTNFKSSSVVQSTYILESSLFKSSKIVSIIN